MRTAKALARLRRSPAHSRSLARAFAGRLCDKYHNLMSWLVLFPDHCLFLYLDKVHPMHHGVFFFFFFFFLYIYKTEQIKRKEGVKIDR